MPAWVIVVLAVFVLWIAFRTITGSAFDERTRAQGEPVVGWVVQANRALWSPGSDDLPAVILVAFDDPKAARSTPPDPDPAVGEMAKQVFATKGRKPQGKVGRAVARLVDDAPFNRWLRVRVPPEIAGDRVVYGMHVYVNRSLLPGQALRHPFVRCLILRDEPSAPPLMTEYVPSDDAYLDGKKGKGKKGKGKRGRVRSAGGGEGNELAEAVIALATSPSAETYMRIFERVVAQPSYEPYGDDLHELMGLFEAGKLDEVERKLGEMMPTWVLTPKLHKVACLTAKRRGREEDAMTEALIARACLEGLLATGKGTRDEPYVVLRVDDEYEVLEHLGKKLVKQELCKDGDRQFDHLTLDDGSDLWFDITTPKTHLDRALAVAKG